MTEDFIIRPALPEDAEPITKVHFKTWQSAYNGIFPGDKLAALGQEFDARIERWESILRNAYRESVVYVAETGDGELIGFVNAGKQHKPEFPQDAELFAIYLLPEYHGKGIGRRLISAAAGKLKQLGYASLLLWVLEENTASRGFYEHLGGRLCGKDEFLRWGQTYQIVAYAWDSLEALSGE